VNHAIIAIPDNPQAPLAKPGIGKVGQSGFM
jgi:hypothetical protein